MDRYCLDANVFIQPKNQFYPFAIVPAFWEFLEQKLLDITFYSVSAIYEELRKQEDDLSNWCQKVNKHNVFIEPTSEVLEQLGLISDYVETYYKPERSMQFSKGADPMLLAQAKADSSVVVTFEIKNNLEQEKKPYGSKVKIPNICEHFEIKYISLYELLSLYKPTFILKGGKEWIENQKTKYQSQFSLTSNKQTNFFLKQNRQKIKINHRRLTILSLRKKVRIKSM